MRAGCFPQPTTGGKPVISVLCHNRVDLTKKCLELLVMHTPACRVIVTDNASSDGTDKFLAQFAILHRNVQVVTNRENLGYKDPHNAAFSTACAMEDPPELFCILNNDLEIGQGWWDRIEVAFASDHKLAVVGSSVGVCTQLNDNFEGGPGNHGQAAEYVEGSLMAIRVDVFRKLGLFDPNLQFIYGEDSDLSLRAREAGYRLAIIDLNCRHLCSQTVRYLNPETKAKIATAKAANHRWLKNRWSVYLKRRTFNYQVLVNREGAIGDVLLMTPALEALKARWPLSDIFVQTQFQAVFSNSDTVRVASSVMRGDFDYKFNLDLAYERVPMLHPVLAYASALGVSVDLDSAQLKLSASKSDEAAAENMVPKFKKRGMVIVHPGPTNWIGRDWPMERWEQVIEWLSNNGHHVAVVGTPWRFPNVIELGRNASLQSIYCLLKAADLFIGVDSGPFHIAQAAMCKSVVLFGTILPSLRVLPSCPVTAVSADRCIAPCVGEHHRLPPPVKFSQCKGDCMRAISVDMVKAAILQSLNENLRNHLHS